MATDDAGRAHPAAGDPGRGAGHDDRPAAATPPDDGGTDDGGSDTAPSAGATFDRTTSRQAPDGATDPDAADGAPPSGAKAEPAVVGAGDPADGVGNGGAPGSPAAPDGGAVGAGAAALPPPAPARDDPDGLPRFLASLDFGPAAGQPAPALSHDRNRRALVLVSSVAAVAVAGLVGAFAALSTSSHAGSQTGPRPVASNGAMLATGSQGPNRFTPPYFGQPTTGSGNGPGSTRPRAHSSAPPSASSSSASDRPSHQPSQAPASTHSSPSPTFPRVSCPPLPSLLGGAAPNILCPLEGSPD